MKTDLPLYMFPHISRARVCLLMSIVCIVSTLSGCAFDMRSPPPVAAPVQEIVVPKPSTADVLMDQLLGLQLLSGNDLVAAREKYRESFERDPSTTNRLNYAITWYLSLTANAAAADEDKLAQLIEPLAVASNTDTASRTVAGLMQQSALSRKKVRDDARYAAQRTNVKREEPGKEAEVRQLRARIDDLEKQLAALKSIERSVTRR
jgi:polyhydroxyalkanoate synthesis regulator phasin